MKILFCILLYSCIFMNCASIKNNDNCGFSTNNLQFIPYKEDSILRFANNQYDTVIFIVSSKTVSLNVIERQVEISSDDFYLYEIRYSSIDSSAFVDRPLLYVKRNCRTGDMTIQGYWLDYWEPINVFTGNDDEFEQFFKDKKGGILVVEPDTNKYPESKDRNIVKIYWDYHKGIIQYQDRNSVNWVRFN